MANLNEIQSTTAAGSPPDVIQSQENAAFQADPTPLEQPEQVQPTSAVDVFENTPSASSPRSAGVFAKSNPSEVIDTIPDSAAGLQTDSRAGDVSQVFELAEIDDFQTIATDNSIGLPLDGITINDLDADLAKMINQESAFSTEPVETLSTEPADDFPVDQPNTGATIDAQDSDLARGTIQVGSKAPMAGVESPDAASKVNAQDPSLATRDSMTATWEAFYQSLVTTNKKQKIELATESSQFAVFVPDGDKPGITFFDQTGNEETLKGSPSEQLERHFAGHGIGDVITTRLPNNMNLELNVTPSSGNQKPVKPNGEVKNQPTQMIVAPFATETQPNYGETAEPRFASSAPPHAMHGPSAALASALVGTAALPFNVLAALNDKVRDFRLAKRSTPDEVALGQPQNPSVENTSQAPAIDISLAEDMPSAHERLSHKLKDYAAAIDRFHETPEMEEVSRALDKYSPENRNKALHDDPAVAKLVHQAVTANPELVKTIHSQANDIEKISEEFDETVFGKLQKEQAKQLQESLKNAQDKTKTLPFHSAFDSLKDKVSSAMSSLFEKLGAVFSKLTQSNRADASASAELS